MSDQIQPSNTEDVDADGKQAEKERTFTQAEVDALVGSTRKKTREQFSDYEELKRAAEKLKELEEKQKTDEQRLREALEQERSARIAAIEKSNKRLIEAEFIRAATVAGVKFPRDAYALAERDGLTFGIENDQIVGVDDAVKTLLDSGRLVIDKVRAPNLDGGAGSGERQTDLSASLTDEEKAIAHRMGISESDYAKSKNKRK